MWSELYKQQMKKQHWKPVTEAADRRERKTLQSYSKTDDIYGLNLFMFPYKWLFSVSSLHLTSASSQMCLILSVGWWEKTPRNDHVILTAHHNLYCITLLHFWDVFGTWRCSWKCYHSDVVVLSWHRYLILHLCALLLIAVALYRLWMMQSIFQRILGLQWGWQSALLVCVTGSAEALRDVRAH